MSNPLQHLNDLKLLPGIPSWLIVNTQYVTVMGSHAYGLANNNSDFDVYGFTIPPKNFIFPHLTGKLTGFGKSAPSFDQYVKHHIMDVDALGGKGREWDITIFGIVKFFELCRQNNPNMLETLFTNEEHVLHCTQIGRLVRDNRHLFISKEAWKRFRGYAFSQLHKCDTKGLGLVTEVREFEEAHRIPHTTNLQYIKRYTKIEKTQDEDGMEARTAFMGLSRRELNKYESLLRLGEEKSKRFNMRKAHGVDTKNLYNVLRLLDEAEQILLEGTIDLQRSREVLKSVRRGEWTYQQVYDWVQEKDKALEVVYAKCDLPTRPPEEPLRELLKGCLEIHFGDLSEEIPNTDWAADALRKIDEILNRNRKKF